MKQKIIEVLMVEPGREPRLVHLTNDLSALQTAVSVGADYVGLIEIIPLNDDMCILCNEEGKLIGLEPNRRLWSDVLCGVSCSFCRQFPHNPRRRADGKTRRRRGKSSTKITLADISPTKFNGINGAYSVWIRIHPNAKT